MDQSLQKFFDVKSSHEKQNAVKILKELVSYVDDWSAKGPKSLYQLPNTIKKNLTEKIIPIIKNEKYDEISSFRTLLFNFLIRIYDKSPSIEDLKYLTDQLESIQKIPESTTVSKTKIGVFEKFPQLKWVWLSPISGAVVFAILSSIDPNQLFLASAFSITISVTVLIGLISLIRLKN